MSNSIAIVGMACIFPKAANLTQFWKNICDGVDAITQVPPNRIDPIFYDPKSKALERLYCRRGGFIDEYAKFDPIKFRVMPNTAKSAEPDQPLVLEVSSQALVDAGYVHRQVPHRRTGVIIGRGAYMASGVRKLETHVHGAEQLIVGMRSILPGISEEELDRLKQEYIRKIDAPDGEHIVGLIPNLCASRIANYYDFKGPAYTVDGACASSLLAVEQGCQMLLSGQTDMMLCGGVHLTHFVSFWAAFSQLRALSRSQMIRPFDTRADGTLLGEGVGMLVLKRKKDAVQEGDRIYALIQGIGSASDGGGQSLISPNLNGQVMALEEAWQKSGLQPDQVGMVEAHGTGTQIGDPVEVETLRRVFGDYSHRTERVGLGTVKSMIGHTMPASGAASLIKAALSVFHAVQPMSLHCEKPLEAIEQTRFRVLQKTENWEQKRRVVGVNSFGFGGINVHVVLENTDISYRSKSFKSDANSEKNGASIGSTRSDGSDSSSMVDLSLGGMTLFTFDKPLSLFDDTTSDLTYSISPSESVSDERVVNSYNQVVQQLLSTQSEILQKFNRTETQPSYSRKPRIPRKLILKREISLQTMPELIDHSFYRQAEGWMDPADLQPLVPMTGLIELMKEAAHELVNDRTIVAVEEVQAINWLRVDKKVDAQIICEYDGRDRIVVTIEGYAKGTVVMEDAYPIAPEQDNTPLSNQRPAPISAEDIYKDHWLFHGPLFQGIKTFGPMADDGMWGEIEENGVRGALLDCAGQIFGLWVAFNTEVDRVALPIRVNRITFYEAFPASGTLLQCKVKIREINTLIVSSDIWVSRKGKLLVAIEGWQDLRLPIDENLFDLLKYPEKTMLCTPVKRDFVILHDKYTTALGRDTLANRYLREAERQEAFELGPRGRRSWVSQCIAAKDAVRNLLWSQGEGDLFPAEIWITRKHDKPEVIEPKGLDLRISTAQKDNVFVAIAALSGTVGIEIERVEERNIQYQQDHFTDDELQLVDDIDYSCSLARMWVAKRAFSKAQEINLDSDLGSIRIIQRDGQQFLISGTWVSTVLYDNYVIGFVGPI